MKGGRNVRLEDLVAASAVRICIDKRHRPLRFESSWGNQHWRYLFSLAPYLSTSKRKLRISFEQETSVSLNWRSCFLSFLVRLLFLRGHTPKSLIVHLFSREHFDSGRKSKGPLLRHLLHRPFWIALRNRTDRVYLEITHRVEECWNYPRNVFYTSSVSRIVWQNCRTTVCTSAWWI